MPPCSDNDSMRAALLAAEPWRAYLPEDRIDNLTDWGQYGLEWAPLDASAIQIPATVQIDSGWDFLVTDISAVVVQNAAQGTEVPFWPLVTRIRDSASGQNWNITEAGTSHLATLAGRMADDGWGPYVLRRPRWVEHGAAVRMELTNLSATALRVWVGLNGVRVSVNLKR